MKLKRILSEMKFGTMLVYWLALSLVVAIAGSLVVRTDLIFVILLVNLSLSALGFLAVVYTDNWYEFAGLPVKDAMRALFYSPDFKKISDNVKLLKEVLLYRIIPNPDKVNYYTIRDQREYLENFLGRISVNSVKLPFKTRIRLYKFYAEQEPFLVKVENAHKNYAYGLRNEEYKNISAEAEKFIASLAKIFDDPGIWTSMYKNKKALSRYDVIEKWESSDLHKCSEWLRKRCYAP